MLGNQRGKRWSSRVSVALVGAAAAGFALVGPAQAAPLFPGGPDISGLGNLLPGTAPAPGANAAPVLPIVPPAAPANFTAPSINPGGGEVVGVAQPIIVRFNDAIGDRGAAERAIRITSNPPVAGHFYWFNDRQVRWRPNEFWPANTQVTVEAGGARSSYSIGDALVTVADDATKQITVTRNGAVVKTMPTSMGKPGHETPNGTYVVGDKFRNMIMDSSTYGVPVKSPEGYRVEVEYATRMSNSGIFVHAAPWSVGSQGSANVSHGCLNVSTENGRWFFENAKKGDPVIVRNTAGGVINGYDGLGDWNL